MKNKLNIIALSLMALLAVFVLLFQHQREKTYKSELLFTRLTDVNKVIYGFLEADSCNDSTSIYKFNYLIKKYIGSFDSLPVNITIFDTIGKIYFESSHNNDFNDYCLTRPEIIQTLKKDIGRDSFHFSKTIGDSRCFLTTYKKNSPFVVRTSLPYAAAFSANLFESFHYLFFTFLFAIAFVVVYILGNKRFKKSSGQKDRLMYHLEITKEGLGLFNADHSLEFCNSRFEKYICHIANQNFEDFNNLDSIADLRQIFAFIDTNSGMFETERMFKTHILKHGRDYRISTVIFPDSSYEIDIIDDTEVMENKQLKEQLTSDISHELKTPLAAITGYVEIMLESSVTPEQQADYLTRIKKQAVRLQQLMHDVATLNRLTQDDSIRKNFADVNLSDVIKNVVNDSLSAIEAAQMTVDLKISDNIDFKGDESLLYSIFKNLVDNSITYAGKGCKISIEQSEKIGDKLHFIVSDNGNGVEDIHLPHLFERFYRPDKSRSHKTGGTGLGLSIVRHAVKIHNGTITVKNSNGLIFDILL